MAQGVLRYNVVIVGKFFNGGSWVSEAWRKEHPEEWEEEAEGPSERIASAEERRARLQLEPRPFGLSVCAVLGHATSTRRSVDVCWKVKPEQRERADLSTNCIENFLQDNDPASICRDVKQAVSSADLLQLASKTRFHCQMRSGAFL